jgi:hypothetical protein
LEFQKAVMGLQLARLRTNSLLSSEATVPRTYILFILLILSEFRLAASGAEEEDWTG